MGKGREGWCRGGEGGAGVGEGREGWCRGGSGWYGEGEGGAGVGEGRERMGFNILFIFLQWTLIQALQYQRLM